MHQPAQLEGDVAPVLEQRAALRAQRPRRLLARGEQRLHHHRHGGGAVDRSGVEERRTQCGALARQQAPPQAGAGQRRQELGPAPPRRVGPPVLVVGSRVERVQPDGTAGTEGHRADAPGIGQVGVLALGVDHPGPAAEDGLSPQERLDEGALAPPDLAEHDHVRVRHHAGVVELEGIEHERAPEQVVPDDDAAPAQAGLGDEGVRRAEVARRDLVGRQARAASGHAGERSGPPHPGVRTSAAGS